MFRFFFLSVPRVKLCKSANYAFSYHAFTPRNGVCVCVNVCIMCNKDSSDSKNNGDYGEY